MWLWAAELLPAAERTCEVNVNVSLTPAGRKIVPPTKEHPVYYFPFVAGWREEGAVMAGEKAPARVLFTQPLARALAGQGYLVMGAETPPPTLLLVFHWGALNPEIDEVGGADPDQPQTMFFNRREMLALVGGQKLDALGLNFEREAVMQAAEDDRYFVIVSAYDYADAVKKKKTLLWQARMSTPSNGVTMPDVVAALVESGAPYFGRETARPEWVRARVREGSVEVGPITVVPDAPAEQSGGAAGKK